MLKNLFYLCDMSELGRSYNYFKEKLKCYKFICCKIMIRLFINEDKVVFFYKREEVN